MQEVVGRCLYETGARGMSRHAEELALIGLLHADQAGDRKRYRRSIRETFLRGHPDVGSIFLMLVLPILISVISQWIAKWIVNRTDLRTIRAEAFDALTELSPATTATLTSISTPPKNQDVRSEW